ncbi:MAG: class II glutamine amidotransferase [Legionellaceae bacterium]|nr:class II glutamine amidotransferase [Legionellaceae bacterium]
MCRLVSYIGEAIALDDVLIKPANSLVMQSLHARESEIRTNGDGFGVGWYVPEMSEEPALFTSVSPAWSNKNLLHLTRKLMSPVFFAHVRAATAGSVSQHNCHPFIYQQWMMMHNGSVVNFKQIKRHVRHLLDDDLYHWVQGETDSEHVFALFLQNAKSRDLNQTEIVADILEETIGQVLALVEQFGGAPTHPASYFNLCLTDGKQLIATRYCSQANIEPSSLHYAVGRQFLIKEGRGEMLKARGRPHCVLVSSERLTQSDATWEAVPPQHLLLVTQDMGVSLRPFQLV